MCPEIKTDRTPECIVPSEITIGYHTRHRADISIESGDLEEYGTDDIEPDDPPGS
jgi:hypothetical protein